MTGKIIYLHSVLRISLIWSSACLANCGSSESLVPVASGGSNGVIIMSATSSLSSPEIDWTASEHIVLDRCQAWNFTGFEAFNLISSECVNSYSYNSCAAWEYDSLQGVSNCIDYEPVQACSRWQFNRNYQCTGPGRQ